MKRVIIECDSIFLHYWIEYELHRMWQQECSRENRYRFAPNKIYRVKNFFRVNGDTFVFGVFWFLSKQWTKFGELFGPPTSHIWIKYVFRFRINILNTDLYISLTYFWSPKFQSYRYKKLDHLQKVYGFDYRISSFHI